MPIRSLRMLLWAAVAVAAIALPLAWLTQTPVATRSSGAGSVGQTAFVLTSSKGGVFDSASLKGRPYAVFFGFTYCPDICPTTTAELSGFLKQLGPAARDFPVLFITVDPERDTAPALADFLSNFDPRIVGLTGTPAQIQSVIRAYGAFAQKQSLAGGGYTMDHSASVYLYGADGALRSTLDYQEKPEVKLAKLKNLLGG